MRWDEEAGRCNVIELRPGLLNDSRVIAVIEETSRSYCHYIRASGETAIVPGCHAPGRGWREYMRKAPNTICVIASENNTYRLAFAIRDGVRVRDRWCENTRILTRTGR